MKRFIAGTVLSILSFSSHAQNLIKVYPTPQQIRFEPNRFINIKSIDVKSAGLASDIEALISSVFPLNSKVKACL